MMTTEIAFQAHSDYILRARRAAADGHRVRRLARLRRQRTTGCG